MQFLIDSIHSKQNYAAWFIACVLSFTWLAYSYGLAWIPFENMDLLVLRILQFIAVMLGIGFLTKAAFSALKKHSTYLLLGFIFILSFWIPLGFDVTDEGTRSGQSWFLFDPIWPQLSGMKVGSYLINSIWLHLFGEPNLLWSRFGFVILQALIAVVIYKIVRTQSTKTIALIAAFAASFFTVIYVYQSINYNNFPTLLVLLCAWIILRPVSNKVQLYLAGALLVMAVLSRFPYILFLGSIVAFLILEYIVDRKQRQNTTSSIGIAAGMLGIAAIISILLWLTGGLESYWDSIYRGFISPFIVKEGSESLSRHMHDPASLQSIYSNTGWRLLEHIFMMAAGILPFLASLFQKRNWLQVLGALSTLIIWALLVEERYWYYGFLAGFLLLHLAILIRHRSMAVSWKYAFWALSILLISFLGSNVGIRNIIMTGGGALYFSWVLVEHLKPRVGSKIAPSGIVICLALVAFTFHFKNQFTYRDARAKDLTAMLSGNGFGIFTTHERAQVVNELLAELQKLSPNSNLKVVNMQMMFNFLGRLEPSSTIYWMLATLTPEERTAYLNGPDAPDHLLLSLKNVRDENWPMIDYCCIEAEIPYFNYYSSYLESPKSNYTKTFDNGMFALYSKQTLRK